MSVYTVLGIIATATSGAALWYLHHRRRKALYRTLRERRFSSIAGYRVVIAHEPDIELCNQFDTTRLISVRNFVDNDTLATLLAQITGARRHAERSFIPAHKKGGTLSYEALHRHAPACISLYHSVQLRAWLSRIIGTPVYPTADYDQSSCSVLCYDRRGDHIGWHFDHNFYRGRHFTVLLSLANRAMQHGTNIENGLSDGMLQRRYAGRVDDVPTPANALVLFEGARVFHRATAIGSDQERIMLSMTFSTDPRIDSWKEALRRIKDTAYFGPRVLFD